MLVGGIAVAWVGAGLLSRIRKDRVMPVIASLLAAIADLLVVETSFSGSTALALPPHQILRAAVALIAGVAVRVADIARGFWGSLCARRP